MPCFHLFPPQELPRKEVLEEVRRGGKYWALETSASAEQGIILNAQPSGISKLGMGDAALSWCLKAYRTIGLEANKGTVLTTLLTNY